MNVVILMGLQASGKSTFYRHYFAGAAVHVSKDNFRKARSPQLRQEREIREALTSGRDVVIDNTNPRREDREAVIKIAQEYGARIVGYVFVTSVVESIERNQRRDVDARVPLVGIYTAAKRWVEPTITEGFDELHWVRWSDDGFEIGHNREFQ